MPYANLQLTDTYDSLFSTSLRNYRKKLEDNVFHELPLLYFLNSKGRKKTIDGGYEIIVPLLYGENTTVKMYSGYDLLDTTPQEGITSARYKWKQMAVSISINRKEERQNAGTTRLIALLETKITQAEKSMKWVLNDLLHGRYGSGYGGSNPKTYGDDSSPSSIGETAAVGFDSTGFNSLDHFVRPIWGMVDLTGAASRVHTVGGVAVTVTTSAGDGYGSFDGSTVSSATNAWWMNLCNPGYKRIKRGGVIGDKTPESEWLYAGTSGGTTFQAMLAGMRIMYNRLSDGGDHPDLILTSQEVYEQYEAALMPLERFTDTKYGDAGFANLKFKGCVLMYDQGITISIPVTAAVATPAVPMYFLNSQYIDWTVDSKTDFTTTPFVRPENQDARTAQVLLMANLVCSNRSKQGVMSIASGDDYK